jgi:hypothetical protein
MDPSACISGLGVMVTGIERVGALKVGVGRAIGSPRGVMWGSPR